MSKTMATLAFSLNLILAVPAWALVSDARLVVGSTMGQPGYNEVALTCPAGYSAISAGIQTNADAIVTVTTNAPMYNGIPLYFMPDGFHAAPNGWYASVDLNGTGGTLKLGVICAQATGLSSRVVSSVLEGGEYTVQATCPAGSAALGGGFDIAPAESFMEWLNLHTSMHSFLDIPPPDNTDGWTVGLYKEALLCVTTPCPQVTFDMKVAAICASGASVYGESKSRTLADYDDFSFSQMCGGTRRAMSGGSSGGSTWRADVIRYAHPLWSDPASAGDGPYYDLLDLADGAYAQGAVGWSFHHQDKNYQDINWGGSSLACVALDGQSAPSTVGFQVSSPSVSESAGHVSLNVARSGGTAGTVSVAYSTSPGTAQAHADYVPVSGTLVWNNGDTGVRNIVIPILNDSLNEGSETFTVMLHSMTGGVLGSAAASVSILDDDVPSPSTYGTAIEYFHAGFGHYFVSAFPDEVAAIDAGTISGWSRTGRTFKVYGQPAGTLSPVCRFFSASFAPKSSHFYTPYPAECESVKQSSVWTYEV